MGELQSDGGLPGSSLEERLLRTTAMLATLRMEENERIREFVRALVARMSRFLRSKLPELGENGYRKTVEHVLENVDRGGTMDTAVAKRLRKLGGGGFANLAEGWAELRRVLTAGLVH
jgi:hypothetical protein